jgi:hypothetical protein
VTSASPGGRRVIQVGSFGEHLLTLIACAQMRVGARRLPAKPN